MSGGHAELVHPAALATAWIDAARLRTDTPPRAAFGLRPQRKPDPALGSIARSIARYRACLDTLDESFPVLEWGLRWCELNAPACDGERTGYSRSRAELIYWQVMEQLSEAVTALQQAPAVAPQPAQAEVNRVRRKLSNAIRDGLFDAPGPRQQMLMATLAQIGHTQISTIDQ